MSQEHKVVDDIKLNTTQPTNLTFKKLYTWTIWQFPRKKKGGLLGAVRPPVAEHGWFPAIIHVKDKKAQVYAHLSKTFASPETAVEYLHNHE